MKARCISQRAGGLLLAVCLTGSCPPSIADEPAGPSEPTAPPPDVPSDERPVDGIRDNSFFVEEAYNQEPGVVQHIFGASFRLDDRGAPRTRAWDLGFTQEWPFFSQTHQLSYTIPYSFVDAEGSHDSGIGDVLLNYRYQLLNDEGNLPAVAPRISLILPSGDEDRGLGSGEVGYQFNLPISKTLTDRVYVNLNAGFTHVPDTRLRFSNGRHSDERDLLGFNLGASVIYAVNDRLHLLLEAVWSSTEGLDERPSAGGRRIFVTRNRAEEVVLSPGIRWAWNLPGDMQIVPGMAVPIGLSEDAVDFGFFFYLSIEHPFTRPSR